MEATGTTSIPAPPIRYHTLGNHPNEETPASAEDKGGIDLWDGILKIISWLAETLGVPNPIQRIWVNSLDTMIRKKFDTQSYAAPKPPRYLTKEQRRQCNSKIVEVFCESMKNYRIAHKIDPHILCHTSYSSSLEEETPNQDGDNALSESVEQWIGDKTEIEIGKPQGEFKEGRLEISHDFLKVFFPLIYPATRGIYPVTKLTISGSIREEDRLLITQEVLKIDTLRELYFEVDKKSAEYFTSALPKILDNHTITNVSLRNYGEVKGFATIQTEIWDTLSAQDQCNIAFINVPQPEGEAPHNKLTFNFATV